MASVDRVGGRPDHRSNRCYPAAVKLRLALLLPGLVIGWLGFVNRWNSDDAFINFRVVDNILAGHGPVFNAGERVEVATSTLWLALLTAGAPLPGAIEWFAAMAGLVLTVTGVVLGGLAAARLHGPTEAGAPRRWAPLGLVVFIAVPPAWHFATSGLESGLTFAWLGGAYLAIVATGSANARPWRDAGIAALVGLGPLIRPDMAVFTAVMLGAWLFVHRARGRVWVVSMGAMALLLPVSYQVFRMGYYGSLVPNTAIAKEASESRPGQGFVYLLDFLAPYLLVLPLVLVAFLLYRRAREWAPRSSVSILTVAPVAAAVVHVGFIVRVGGDFMHGRLLLPAFFAILLPVAVVPYRRDRVRTVLPIAAVGTWAVVTALGLRPAYYGTDLIPPDNGGIADEHGFYVAFTKNAHPVTLEDHRRGGFLSAAGVVQDHVDRGLSYVNPSPFTLSEPSELEVRDGVAQSIVTSFGTIGVFGYDLGPDVWVVDALGLGDPFAARTALPPHRQGRIGHEKTLHPAWVVARFAQNPPADDPQVVAATRALECGSTAVLEESVRGHLTWRRFVENLFASPELTGLRLPPLPTEVESQEC